MKSNLLKAARIKRNLNQTQVSEKLNIAKSTFSKKESGVIQLKITEIKILIDLYKLTRDEVLEIFFEY